MTVDTNIFMFGVLEYPVFRNRAPRLHLSASGGRELTLQAPGAKSKRPAEKLIFYLDLGVDTGTLDRVQFPSWKINMKFAP
ncbi:MAG TPA: hypothetical protein VF268_10515 [Gammaproteobacteria bacterium]